MINPITMFRQWRKRRGIKRLKRALVDMTTIVCGTQIDAIVRAPIPSDADRKAETLRKAMAITDVYISQAKSIIEIMKTDFDSKTKPMVAGGIANGSVNPIVHERVEELNKHVVPMSEDAMKNLAEKLSASITIKGKECEHEFTKILKESSNAETPEEVMCWKCDKIYPFITSGEAIRKSIKKGESNT